MNPLIRPATLALIGVLTAAVTLAADESSTRETSPPHSLDAAVEMSGGVMAAGVGYSWGHGVLTYHGDKVPFCIRGLSVGDVGVAKLKANGVVFDLNDKHDFAGKYVAASMGVAIVGGESTTVLKNKQGVTMQLETKIKGLRFNISASGLRIWLPKKNGACS